jgi:hypothetical protein
MPKREIPRGHVLLRIEDLAALLAGLPGRPAIPPADPPPPADDAWSGITAAVAMVTARLGGQGGDSIAQLADGVGPTAIIGALVSMTAAALKHCLDDDAEGFLQNMAMTAARRGCGLDEETPDAA